MLHARVDAGDSHLKRVFSKYETDKDVYQLIDALKALQLEEQSEEEEGEDEEVRAIALLCNVPCVRVCMHHSSLGLWRRLLG
jgi:NADH:ubiquinone oxidoreductase subunit E